MRRIWICLVILPVLAESPSERIGTIDFYGYGNLDVAALRASLPFHEGDRIPSKTLREAALLAVGNAAKRPAKLSGVCCLPDGRSSIYIGIEEEHAPPIVYQPAPTGFVRLPAEVLAIFRQLDKDYTAAIRRGVAGEDDSQGYALFEDPQSRADQVKLREWALANTAAIRKVLEAGREASQRAYAAEALGYAERSGAQIDALTVAAFDSDETVRNNAVRALEVLCVAGKEVTSRIPAGLFIPLLHSVTWTDRNKGLLLFMRLTAWRDPVLLKLLHDEALTPLREMAQWNDFGHATAALTILGRIAGIDEARLDRLDRPMAAEILKAAH